MSNEDKERKHCEEAAKALMEKSQTMAVDSTKAVMANWWVVADAIQQERADAVAQAELQFRKLLWLGHGHEGLYGDDGEMQCAACMTFRVWDYKRAPLEEVVKTALRAARSRP